MSSVSPSLATHKRPIEHHAITWRGIGVTVVYTPDFHAEPGSPVHHSHLEVMSEASPRVPLPMTETGYRSVFLPGDAIEDSGGPVSYVTRWLDHAAKSTSWKSREAEQRQGCLF